MADLGTVAKGDGGADNCVTTVTATLVNTVAVTAVNVSVGCTLPTPVASIPGESGADSATITAVAGSATAKKV